MIYVLCEDSGSGMQFFEDLCTISLSKDQFEIISTRGNNGFRRALVEIGRLLNSGDGLVLAFDNINGTSGFNALDVIEIAEDICKHKNVLLHIPKYYCFEEIFVSSKRLRTVCSKPLLLNTLQYIDKCLNSGKEYYLKDNEIIKAFISVEPGAAVNKEHFCKQLLRRTLLNVVGDHTISSCHFGTCWLHSCCNVDIRNKVYQCQKCMDYGYSCAAEPPVQRGESHLSRLTEPLVFNYSANAGSNP